MCKTGKEATTVLSLHKKKHTMKTIHENSIAVPYLH